MTIPLVVGVDGSEASLEAADWAADEAVRHDVPLHVLHAAGRDEEQVDVVGRTAERVRARAPSVRLSTEVLREDAAAALVDKGRDAFALVLGSRGLGDLAGMLLGSVSLAVAARAHCPVVVVRGGAAHRGAAAGDVVVGVEDEESSGTAVRFAFREAQARRCRLVAVHAWSVPVATPTPPGLSGYALQALERPPAQVLADALHDPGQRYPDVPVTREVVDGSARRALLKASAEADLLVVGARRRNGHIGLQLGLVNHALLHHAPCPIVVVPQT
ncbi:universal stress protein [Streptomyces heilongjiangensis]|uniref:Universal stress protein n=1 Tax=Streptomyces heilongjiangensis TaxID=945052 RepID=A0ABW1AZP9_9ACTN|nr:universal stress protein [Streptomyces heilongjiangensis]MDC2946515.1 universal stress protein [Streptomyces heilongjiangensis]